MTSSSAWKLAGAGVVTGRLGVGGKQSLRSLPSPRCYAAPLSRKGRGVKRKPLAVSSSPLRGEAGRG